MIRNCDNCGCESDDYWMMRFNPGGAGEKWFCWDCFKQSQYEANKSDKHRQQRLYKIHNSKKRSGRL